MLSRNTTHTLTREASLGLNFTYYNYIDGQGFMVMKDSGIKSTLELDGASICVQAGTTTELNMADYFRNNNMKFTPVGYETSTQTREGFEGGACDVLTSDKSQLAALSTEMKVGPAGVTILPETISKEPLGPVVRQGDDQWMDIVAMTLYALINAEELGITSGNIDSLKSNLVIPAWLAWLAPKVIWVSYWVWVQTGHIMRSSRSVTMARSMSVRSLKSGFRVRGQSMTFGRVAGFFTLHRFDNLV